MLKIICIFFFLTFRVIPIEAILKLEFWKIFKVKWVFTDLVSGNVFTSTYMTF